MELSKASKYCRDIIFTISQYFIGNRPIIEKTLASALVNGHVLFEDHPGLGKTLLAKTFARVIGCDFTRIQFTPDLLPSDIIGTKVWRMKLETFELVRGPIFTNILLADEINRAPPKTQAALLEAMEERQVTIEGVTYKLEEPFFVLATQNPLEYEGTYPLPEAQLDRFLLRLSTGYPTPENLIKILRSRLEWGKDDPTSDIKPIISKNAFLELQKTVEHNIYIDETVLEYITKIVESIRTDPRVVAGPSPRGALALMKLSRALALIRGRDFVIPDDVKTFTIPALAHRIILKTEYILEGLMPEDIVREAVSKVPVPKEVKKT
ncbi:MAG: magnesium chelatase [Thermoprotei archaeon]|nr:MAG: magnesium chelatase [Thermoprotei archaeon]